MITKIVTPLGEVLNEDKVQSITLPTSAGVITIKDHHVPLVSSVVPGEIVVTLEDNTVLSLAVSRGIIQIDRHEYDEDIEENMQAAMDSGGIVRVLADTAEHAADIDVDKAREARKRAEEFLAQTHEKGEITDFANTQLIQATIEKELARERVANRYKNVGGN